MKPKLSILIATLGRRHQKFSELLFSLINQTQSYPGRIEILAFWNNGEYPIGEIRQHLLESARGDYICFVDDDDRLPDYYCDEIMKAIKSTPDYIGFKVKLYNNGIERQPVYHSIRYTGWHQDSDGYYRGVTHLNPIRRSIATEGSFAIAEGAEDEGWARQVRPFVKSEIFIDRDMYFYLHDTEDSSFGGVKTNEGTYTRPIISFKNFKFVEKI